MSSTDRISTHLRGLVLNDRRSLPLPCSLSHLLQGRPWNDSPQDRPWCCCHGAPEGLRGCSSSLRQEEACRCSPGSPCPPSPPRPQVLHRWPSQPRGWLEVPGRCRQVRIKYSEMDSGEDFATEVAVSWLTEFFFQLQTRGAQKGQEQCILRAQEGRSPPTRPGPEVGRCQRPDQEPACSVRILDTSLRGWLLVSLMGWVEIANGLLSARLFGRRTDRPCSHCPYLIMNIPQ